ncbi:MAG: B12-binding domain-containing radical SAM protein, partial [Candidatus Eremiobacterota bacterium]
DDNMKTMKETLELAKRLNCEYANFYATMAYPGSKLYEYALEKHIKLPENWLGYGQLSEDTLPLPTKYLSAEEVLWFRDKAFDDYYGSNEYLNMMEQKFGSHLVEHIRDMLKYKLKRKHAVK